MKRFIINAASLALTLTLPLGARPAEDKFVREAMAKDVANQVGAET